MKRVKKYFFILLTVLVVMTLAACAPNESNRGASDGVASSLPATGTPVVAPPSPPPVITQMPSPSPEPTPEAEKSFFMVKEYKVYYEIVPQAEHQQVVGALAQYVDSGSFIQLGRCWFSYFRHNRADGSKP